MLAKWRSFAVATVSPAAAAVAATTMSIALRGRPAAVPSAMRRAHSSAAHSSKGSTRPAKSACGPSGPANHASGSRRRRPGAFSRMPRRIPATVSAEMCSASSCCAPSYATSAGDGRGFTASLTMFVSSR